jgi:Prenyltransferase and squalene oxidase repeat
MRRFLTGFLLTGLAIAAEAPQAAVLRDAVERGLGLLEKTSPQFIKRGGCNSCHNQFLPAAAQAMARERGIAVGKEFAQLSVEAREEPPDRIAELIATGGVNSVGYQMFVDAALKRPADARSAALIHYLFATQETDGRWQTAGNRPPMTYDDFNTTAFAIFALREYAPESQRAEARKGIDRAASWLLEANPRATQERAFHLLGLAWANASRDAIAKSAAGLITHQRQDGGWSQLPTMESDAYATGEALYALHEGGGVPANDPAYRRGIEFLIKSQAKDGSWRVKTRSLPIQPYFESGFPYGHDQWISSAGTSWAAMALTVAVEPMRVSRR